MASNCRRSREGWQRQAQRSGRERVTSEKERKERVKKEWVVQQWKLACDGQMLLVLEEHKAQTTEYIRNCL